MSESDGIGSFFGSSIRLIIFLVLLVVASPFLAIGYYKNGQIKSSMDIGINYIKIQKYVQAQEKFEGAADQLGFLYDCYVTALPIVGGKYYEKKVVFGLRGVARSLAIGERMGNGDFDVMPLLKEADSDINTRGSFPAGMAVLKELGETALRSYRQLLPVHASCKKGDYSAAYKELAEIMQTNPHIKFDAVGLPICYLLHQIAINLKTDRAISLARDYTLGMAKNNEHPLFQTFAHQISALSPAAAPSRRVDKSRPEGLKEKYQLGLSHAKRKDFAKAAPILEECYNAEPRNDVIVYALAMVKRQMGQNEEAKKLCQAILERNPGDKKAEKLLAALNK